MNKVSDVYYEMCSKSQPNQNVLFTFRILRVMNMIHFNMFSSNVLSTA